MSRQKSIKDIASEINMYRGERQIHDLLFTSAITTLIVRSIELDKENEELRKQIKEK